MARVISIHEYDLKPGADVAAFRRAIRDAERRGLFALAGLVEHHFLKGIKGARRDAYSAVWIFESRAAWEKLWGSVEAPRPPAKYPKTWTVWENEILAPLPGPSSRHDPLHQLRRTLKPDPRPIGDLPTIIAGKLRKAGLQLSRQPAGPGSRRVA
jgi:hypothetical protein